MATDSERLVVALEARVNQFERELNRAQRTATRQATAIQNRFNAANQNVAGGMHRLAGQIRLIEGPLGGVAGRFTTFNQQLREVGPAAAIAVAGIAGVTIAAQRLYSYARSTISELSALAQAADRVGLATDDFQRLQFGFERVGVSARDVETGMRRFARRIGEASAGGGILHDVLEANNVALRDADGRMRSQMDLLRDYADLIKNAGSHQERLALAFKAFDVGGAAMVRALEDGADGLGTLMDKADEAGGVIEERLLRKAEEFDDRWAAGWRNFSINAKSAVMEVITWLDDFMAKSDQVGNHPIFRWLAERMPTVGGADLTWMDPDLARAHGQPLGPDARITDAFSGPLREADQALIDALKQRYGVVTEEATRTIIPEGGSGRRGGGRASARDRAAEAALREAEAVAKLIENLEHELATIGLTDTERAKANALRQAGAAATDEQREKIGQLIEAIHAEREAMERAAEASRFFQQVTEDAFMSLIPTINTGNQALDNLLNTLIKVVAQAMLLGKGPLAGLFGGGGILGGIFPFAQGGVAAHGRPQPMKTFARGGISRTAAIFGETGQPEAAVPLPDGRRIPVDLRMPESARPNGSGPKEITLRVIGEEGPMFRPTIQSESRDVAVKVVRSSSKARNNLYDNGGHPR